MRRCSRGEEAAPRLWCSWGSTARAARSCVRSRGRAERRAILAMILSRSPMAFSGSETVACWAESISVATAW